MQKQMDCNADARFDTCKNTRDSDAADGATPLPRY